MSLKYEPSSEPLHISDRTFASGLGILALAVVFCARELDPVLPLALQKSRPCPDIGIEKVATLPGHPSK